MYNRVHDTHHCDRDGRVWGAKTYWDYFPDDCIPPYIAVDNYSDNAFLIDRIRLCHQTAGCDPDAKWGANKGNGWCVSADTGDEFTSGDLDAQVSIFSWYAFCISQYAVF